MTLKASWLSSLAVSTSQVAAFLVPKIHLAFKHLTYGRWCLTSPLKCSHHNLCLKQPNHQNKQWKDMMQTTGMLKPYLSICWIFNLMLWQHCLQSVPSTKHLFYENIMFWLTWFCCQKHSLKLVQHLANNPFCDLKQNTIVDYIPVQSMGSILTIWNASIKRKMQVALWADLRCCCYYAGGINYFCDRRKSKMGWSEVATLFIGVVLA